MQYHERPSLKHIFKFFYHFSPFKSNIIFKGPYLTAFETNFEIGRTDRYSERKKNNGVPRSIAASKMELFVT